MNIVALYLIVDTRNGGGGGGGGGKCIRDYHHSWKRIGGADIFCSSPWKFSTLGMVANTDGAVHWWIKSRENPYEDRELEQILSLDLEAERFLTIKWPEQQRKRPFGPGISFVGLKGRLCLVHYPDEAVNGGGGSMDIWMLNDVVTSSWTKQFTILLPCLDGCSYQFLPLHLGETEMLFKANSIPGLGTKSVKYFYNLETESFRIAGDVQTGQQGGLYVYCNGLFSP